MSENCLYGLSAEFEAADDLLQAARKARDAGYKEIRAYSPYEVHGLSEVLGYKSTFLPWLVLIALITGVVVAFGIQYWTSVVDYPLNVGGRPYFSWPAFMPIMFEFGILFGGIAAAVFMFVRTGLPQPYHPIFNTEGIENATYSRFFLCIQVDDQKFHLTNTRSFLEGLNPVKVSNVTC